MSKTYCGYNWDDMNDVLNTLCYLQEDAMLTDREYEALEIGIQCVTSILNALEGYPVLIDED